MRFSDASKRCARPVRQAAYSDSISASCVDPAVHLHSCGAAYPCMLSRDQHVGGWGDRFDTQSLQFSGLGVAWSAQASAKLHAFCFGQLQGSPSQARTRLVDSCRLSSRCVSNVPSSSPPFESPFELAWERSASVWAHRSLRS